MKYYISGGSKLKGEVTIQGAKNSVVALICASVLVSGGVFIKRCPKIYDVICLTKILRKMGAKASFEADGLYLNTDGMTSFCLPEKLTGDVRASLFMVGALVARFGMACIYRPGGCAIGARPIDIHVDAMRRLGAEFYEENGFYRFTCEKLSGARFRLKYPSVGATENAMMAATLADGVTIIENCAKEPEIVDLQSFLNLCGAKISGAGTGFIRVEGVKKLQGVDFSPIPDRIETGTFLLACAACSGELEIKGTRPQNIYALTEKLTNNACKIYANNDNIYIRVNNKLKGLGEIVTSPYPGFPTDLQPLVSAVACSSELKAKTVIKETVFESRFRYVTELKKMGADIEVDGDKIIVYGSNLFAAKVDAPDLRGGAGLCLAALVAEGTTEIGNIRLIERGYENFDKKLSALGAKIVWK